jgi:5,10-methylenetetrahydromethanopterin reductase
MARSDTARPVTTWSRRVSTVRTMEMWTMSVPIISGAVERARRAEEAGWHGITFTDSQNLCPDPFVVFAAVAGGTERIKLATGVTNVHTRHPAALATAAATVNELAEGRFVLGTGRGDTALFHLGLPPMPVAEFFERTTRLQKYLSGGTIDIDGRESRIRWLDSAHAGKVPLDIAASGPKVIEFSARTAERITFALGADPDRIAWGIDLARAAAADAGRAPGDVTFGSYVSIGCHPDIEAARAMVHGSVAAFAHFSSMPGSTGAGLAEQDRGIVADVGRTYDSNQHLRNDATHTAALTGEFIDRFAVTGTPDRVIERLTQLAALGIDRFVVTGPGFGADRDDARLASQLLTSEVLPALA